MSKVISLKLTENLHCPDCGAEITVEVKPCIHLSFIYLEESREFYYVSDNFSQTGEKILEINNRHEEMYFNNNDIAVPRIINILSSVLGKNSNSIIFEVKNAESVSGVSFLNMPVVQSIYYGFEF